MNIRDSIDTTTAVGRAMFKMLAVLAEMERDLISEHTKAGLGSARGLEGVRVEDLRKMIRFYLKHICSETVEVFIEWS